MEHLMKLELKKVHFKKLYSAFDADDRTEYVFRFCLTQ